MTAQMDLLDLLSHDPRKEDEYRQFLDACRSARMGQREYVSINAVRERMSNEWGLTIHPQTYSTFWSRARKEGLLSRTNIVEANDDTRSRNAGRPQYLWRWVGGDAMT